MSRSPKRDKISRPPVDCNPEIAALADALLDTIKVTRYERESLRALLSASRPLCAGEVANYCAVPRTKIYATYRNMVKKGLLVEYSLTEENLEKPDVWEWWPDKNRRAFLSRYGVGVNYYTVNLPYLMKLHETWCAELNHRMERVGRLIELLKKRQEGSA